MDPTHRLIFNRRISPSVQQENVSSVGLTEDLLCEIWLNRGSTMKPYVALAVRQIPDIRRKVQAAGWDEL